MQIMQASNSPHKIISPYFALDLDGLIGARVEVLTVIEIAQRRIAATAERGVIAVVGQVRCGHSLSAQL